MRRLIVLGLLAAIAAGSAAGSTTPYTQAELRALNSPKLNAAIVESMRGSKPGDTLDDVMP